MICNRASTHNNVLTSAAALNQSLHLLTVYGTLLLHFLPSLVSHGDVSLVDVYAVRLHYRLLGLASCLLRDGATVHIVVLRMVHLHVQLPGGTSQVPHGELCIIPKA